MAHLPEWRYTQAEEQSAFSRLNWAENLILQLPKNHDGRNSWLMNYGIGTEAANFRKKRNLVFNPETRAVGD